MTDQWIANEQTVELLAGLHPNGQPIFENILVTDGGEKDRYRLLKSPQFVRGIAAGDLIQKRAGQRGAFELVEHSGNLSVRVFCRGDIDALERELTPPMDKIGADLDLRTERALVYSVHVSIGFKAIEEVLNQFVGEQSDSLWVYGNVYDEQRGEPLNWWIDIAEV